VDFAVRIPIFPLVTHGPVTITTVVDWPGRIGPADEVTLGEAAELPRLPMGWVLELVESDLLPARADTAVTRISLADIEMPALGGDRARPEEVLELDRLRP
jgi:hypothetical protein